MSGILVFSELEHKIKSLRGDKKIIHAHGTFDMLHAGHILHLKNAKAMYPDSVLVVTVTDDANVRINKGQDRPFCNEESRVSLLAGLRCVDYVCIVNDATALPAIQSIKPDIYVKGGEYAAKLGTDRTLKQEKELVEHHGGQVVFADSALPEMSTSVQAAATETDNLFGFLREFTKLSSKADLLNLLTAMTQKSMLIVGDAIFDMTTMAGVGDKAPKTTILPMMHRSWDQRTIKSLGGALFMAETASGFADHVSIVAGIGEADFIDGFQFPANQLLDDLLSKKIKSFFYYLPDRCPNVKWRFKEDVFQENKQRQTLAQICCLSQQPYPREIQQQILETTADMLPLHDVVICADFGHGYFTDELYSLISNSDNSDIFVAAMTQANEANYGLNTLWRIPKADLLCLDDVELRLAFGSEFGKIKSMAKILTDTGRFNTVAVTQGKQGCLMTTRNASVCVPAFRADVVDRIGAGDTFMVVATLALSCGATPSQAGLLANIGGALACAIQSNTMSVTIDEIMYYVEKLFK